MPLDPTSIKKPEGGCNFRACFPNYITSQRAVEVVAWLARFSGRRHREAARGSGSVISTKKMTLLERERGPVFRPWPRPRRRANR